MYPPAFVAPIVDDDHVRISPRSLHQKARVTGLLCGITCTILCLAILIQYHCVTHAQTHTDMRKAYTALA